MSNTSENTQPAMAYPTTDQYQQWKDNAEEMDMSVSKFMQAMVEAGRKKFTVDVIPDETNHELRQQRNDLKEELAHARGRIEEVEEQLYRGERKVIRRFVEENPGATYGEIGQKIADTVPDRVPQYLEELEGEELRREGEQYYPSEEE